MTYYLKYLKIFSIFMHVRFIYCIMEIQAFLHDIYIHAHTHIYIYIYRFFKMIIIGVNALKNLMMEIFWRSHLYANIFYYKNIIRCVIDYLYLCCIPIIAYNTQNKHDILYYKSTRKYVVHSLYLCCTSTISDNTKNKHTHIDEWRYMSMSSYIAFLVNYCR